MASHRTLRLLPILAALAIFAIVRAEAQSPPISPTTPAPMTAEQRARETRDAWAAAVKTATQGPATVTLLDQGQLVLPENMAFVPKAEAGRILRSYGNSLSPNLVGLVTGTGENDSWIVVIRFIKEGYIKDDDAKDWNADDLLANIKEGTAEGNEERAQRGFPKIEILGWIEKPAYDAKSHRLVWSMASKSEGEADGADRSVNYNTYALGREGYFSLNLLTEQSQVEAQKPVARTLLANLGYDVGKRYQDFDSKTDQVAAYGLAALVGGVAAKKLGLFAVLLAFLAKFAKVGLIALAAIGAGVAKFFRRSPKQAPAMAASPAPEPPPSSDKPS